MGQVVGKALELLQLWRGGGSLAVGMIKSRPTLQLTPPQSWPTSLPSLSSCLTATQNPVCVALHNEHIVFKPWTWTSAAWTRFHPALPIKTSELLLFFLGPISSFHADLFEPLQRPKRSRCPGPHAVQYFPLERALWKWRKFSAEMLWFQLPPPPPFPTKSEENEYLIICSLLSAVTAQSKICTHQTKRNVFKPFWLPPSIVLGPRLAVGFWTEPLQPQYQSSSFGNVDDTTKDTTPKGLKNYTQKWECGEITWARAGKDICWCPIIK